MQHTGDRRLHNHTFVPLSMKLPRMWPRLLHSVRARGRGRDIHRTPSAQQTGVAEAVSTVDNASLEALELRNSFVDELPGDPDTSNSLRQVNNALYSLVSPTATGTEPYLVACSSAVADMIGLSSSECRRPEFASMFSGQTTLSQAAGKTYAQCYGGHQFGMWAGQLGDGRAINLGAAVSPDGSTWELQLKGAGRTPYSRRADGRAVMRSSLREFVGSEALAALGVPTTRALALVGTGDSVLRDMFYNGNVRLEPGAVVTRVARSFVRFGSFQLPASRGEDQWPLVRLLADYVIRHHYPHLKGRKDAYAQLVAEVSRRTGHLVALWQSVGFTHGVLNTDNMSILGETIDYGPYGFLEAFDPDFTPNASDLGGKRYTYRNQPGVCQWNLAQFASAMVIAGLLEKEAAQDAVEQYASALSERYNSLAAQKLGLQQYNRELAVELLTLMAEDAADFTNTFRALGAVRAVDDAPESLPPPLQQALAHVEAPERAAAWGRWLAQYRAALREQGVPDAQRRTVQDAANPAYVPRNHLMQAAIAAAEQRSFQELEELMAVLKQPYMEQPGKERFRVPAPVQPRMGVEMLSCSS